MGLAGSWMGTYWPATALPYALSLDASYVLDVILLDVYRVNWQDVKVLVLGVDV
jgi:hypothetical protein